MDFARLNSIAFYLLYRGVTITQVLYTDSWVAQSRQKDCRERALDIRILGPEHVDCGTYTFNDT